MDNNLLIDLPELKLPRDLARRVKFVDAVERHVEAIGVRGHYEPSRFVGYYFAGDLPVVVSGQWSVTLEMVPLLRDLGTLLDRITDGRFSIESRSELATPQFILVHDTYDGSCWLWEYGCGRRFLEAKEPRSYRWPGSKGDLPRDEGPRLLGP